MEDIRLAMGLIGFVTFATFLGTSRLLHGQSRRILTAMAALVVGLIVLYTVTVWGQLWIVNWIPLPSVIVLSNWFPPLLGALAAIVWRQMETQSVLRRLPVMTLMLAAGVFSVAYFIPAEAPDCDDVWENPPMVLRSVVNWPVCKQTTKYTCSAASAATILNTLDIETTEQEMAQLCLTKLGTHWLGLYHGLSTQLIGTSHRVEFFEGDVNSLKEMASVHPVLLCCQLNRDDAKAVPAYVEDGGWIPGTAHSVVYFGDIMGRGGETMHVIGDPTRGFELWSTDDLNVLWTGEGLKIGHYGDGAKRSTRLPASD